VARDLSQSVVVPTGASSGTGRATALAFAAAGSRLVLAERRERALRDAADECRRRGADAVAVPTDVRDAAGMARLADAAGSRCSTISRCRCSSAS
jgi:NADP-dependent 3-hydroxy acid dehydrogenase YdfG